MLLSTLVALLILASLVLTLQKQAAANTWVIQRLSSELQRQSIEDALYERLRVLVADAMTGRTEGRPKLNSEDFPITYAGHQWIIRAQDVEGLVDIYLGEPETLALLLTDVGAFVANRDQALAQLAPSERFPSLAASLAKFGLQDPTLETLGTQLSQSGNLKTSTLPRELRDRASGRPPSLHEGDQVVHVTISMEPESP